MKKYSYIVTISLLTVLFSRLWGQEADQRPTALTDSLLEKYSIEELLEFKRYYQEQMKALHQDKKQLRQITISEGKAFIEQHPESKILDKVYMRLAELYYTKAIEDYLVLEQKYDQLLADYEKHRLQERPQEPKKDFSKCLEMYDRILQDFPHSNLIDDVIYNKGFIYEEMNELETALKIYQKIIDEFTDSRYVPEAYMRIGEYHFNPPQNNIEKAIEIYKEVLAFKDSPRYDEALYRLGWSYYRLNMYPEAVAYFTLLADDVERSKILDPAQKYTNPTLRDESVEYIGISFLDYGGVENAASYFRDIGGRNYGLEVLQKIGDVYMEEKEEYEKAINAYQILLSMYPLAPQAPVIQSKLILGYRHLENDMMAYLARKTLFSKYQPESEWWQQNEDSEAKEKALLLCKKSMEDNISLLYQRANDLTDIDLFRQAVQDSRDYLKFFNSDSNAALIHWNMAVTLDMKLKKHDEAFEEYLLISERYWESKHQKWAAENAIALAKEAATNADSLAQIGRDETRTVTGTSLETDDRNRFASALRHQAMEMSEADKKLGRAYDNYIMLFPHGKETAIFLANAGALYYNRNQFQKALRYFNTLVRHFPESQDVDYAKYRIMECYFGKRDFQSSEIVARKLIETAKTAELTRKAKKRLAESIFLNAETLADSGLHLKAGNEYVRVVVEVPDILFADLALFNGALQYDEAHEFRRAVETYDYLINNYSRSKYRLDAMNNLALDYGELNEFRNAAISYEKLAAAHQDQEQAKNSLFNASVFYVRAKDWKSAIRVNKDYVRRFPDSEDADDLYFDIAGYHLKLNELDQANQIYGEYAAKYPNSPRVVETHFCRGAFYQQTGQREQAKQEFAFAFEKHEALKAQNIEANDYFAAEALFALTELQFDDFINIEITGNDAEIEAAKKSKKALLLEIVENYAKVARFGTIRLYEATYKIGRAYEEFAAAWARQEFPPMDENRRVVALKEAKEAAANLYERAEKSFINSVEVLTRIANDYEAYLNKPSLTLPDSSTDQPDAPKVSGRVTLEDSTLYVARKWIERSQAKISEIIYDIAELNQEAIKEFLTAPVPDGLDEVSALEYRNQILNRAVRPMIEQIVSAHARNIRVAHELNLQNQWVDLSKKKIVSTNNVLSLEYQQMAYDALDLYGQKSRAFLTLTKQRQDAIDISDQMATLIDYANAFSRAMIQLFQNTIVKGREQALEENFVQTTEMSMMKTAFNLSMMMDSLANEVNQWRKESERLFKETDKKEFEDAIYALEDNFFSFRETKKAVLETAYEVSKELGIANLWTNQVLFELVKTAPETYKSLLDLKSSAVTVVSDKTWKSSITHESDWTKLDFDDTDWANCTLAEFESITSSNEARWIWQVTTDTVKVPVAPQEDEIELASSDSTALASHSLKDVRNLRRKSILDSNIVAFDELRQVNADKNNSTKFSYEYRSAPAKRIYFRKTIEIDGLPVSGDIVLTVDDGYNLFLNGEYIAASKSEVDNWQIENSYRLNDYLRLGANVVAIEASDRDASGKGLKVVFNFTFLPDWGEKQKQFKFQIMDEADKERLIFNKNVIIY